MKTGLIAKAAHEIEAARTGATTGNKKLPAWSELDDKERIAKHEAVQKCVADLSKKPAKKLGEKAAVFRQVCRSLIRL